MKLFSKYKDPRLCARHPEVQGKASQPPCDCLLPAGTPTAGPRSPALCASHLPAPGASEKHPAPASPGFRPLLRPLDSQGSCVGVRSRKCTLGGTHVSTQGARFREIRLCWVMINGDKSAQEKLNLTSISALSFRSPPAAAGRRHVFPLARAQTTSRGGKQSPEI